MAASWKSGTFSYEPDDGATPPPARPAQPNLVDPGKVPRRRLNGPAGRAALLHAIAHIEFNAIDLAFDLVARFAGDPRIPDDRRADFINDWVQVGDDEARHFILIEDRLNALEFSYGDHPAHNGLWDAALATQHDLAARLAVAPLVLEARGLDVTPGMIDRLKYAGDGESAAILEIIYSEEVAHVAAGIRWFRHVADSDNQDVETYYHTLVREHFRGGLKLPFNMEARLKAGFPPEFYAPLAQ